MYTLNVYQFTVNSKLIIIVIKIWKIKALRSLTNGLFSMQSYVISVWVEIGY